MSKALIRIGIFLFLLSAAAFARGSATADERGSSPAFIDAGDYVYISGQGPRGPDGTVPPSFPEQCRQALENLKKTVESAGLTTAHVVYTQVYLESISNHEAMNRIFGSYFRDPRPAQAVLGVARLPDPGIEINAVAVRDLTQRRAIAASNTNNEAASPAILTRDRLFVSAMLGVDSNGKVPAEPAAQVDLALDHLKAVVEAAGLDLRNIVFVNPYLTAQIPMKTMNERYAARFEFGNTPARATIQVTSLPGGTNIEYTGVAVRDLQQRHRKPLRVSG
jgi:2-iminobutanoate/2-iminopropanoate deaminase